MKFITRSNSRLSERCRSPCGERGLKYPAPKSVRCLMASLPVRGAWVEIICSQFAMALCCGRSPCGERGLKFPVIFAMPFLQHVAPRAGSVG